MPRVRLEVAGRETVAAPAAAMWQGIQSPEVLTRVLRRAETLRRVRHSASTECFEIRMPLKIGNVGVVCNAEFTVKSQDSAQAYVVKGSGDAGRTAHGSGDGTVSFQSHPVGCIVEYAFAFTVEGRLARLGRRVMRPAAQRLVIHFFQSVSREVMPSGSV